MLKQRSLQVALAVWAVAVYATLIMAARDGYYLSVVFCAWAASPLTLNALRVLFEEDKPTGLFDLRTQSWAFLLGDTILLPAALVIASAGWGVVNVSQHFWQFWWFAVALFVGFGAGVLFHLLDGITYTRAGARAALDSPTKLAHDFVAYPVLFGAMLALGLPLLLADMLPYGVMFVICLMLWLACCVRDARARLDPLKLHPMWNPRSFRPIS